MESDFIIIILFNILKKSEIYNEEGDGLESASAMEAVCLYMPLRTARALFHFH